MHRVLIARTTPAASALRPQVRQPRPELPHRPSAPAHNQMHTFDGSAASSKAGELPRYMTQHSMSIPMRTRAAVLAALPLTIADSNFCALASMSQWDSLQPGQHPSATLAHAAAVREQQVSSISSRNLGREAELELELRRTRDELAAAQAWMRQAREKLGMPHSDP